MRTFNTTGPVRPERHYCIPPLERVDLEDVLALVRDERYFVLHAPRQTGKTSTLLALRDLLNSGAHGEYRCVYVNVEAGQAARENVKEAMRAVLGHLANQARLTLGDDSLERAWPAALETAGALNALHRLLTAWSEADARPAVVLIDEIDALIGDTLISVLRQLRAGYTDRPDHFPQSVILCGVRDVRDYRIHSSVEGTVVTGGSAFNIKARSLRLGDFTRQEVRELLCQHTEETGQPYTPEALETVWEQTRGQPWLVNALADEACFRKRSGRDRTRAVQADDIREARERLILQRETHLDQLADKLQEARVRRVVEPLLSGGGEPVYSGRDLEYARDLGLVAADDPVRVANPIYAEVIPRQLTAAVQSGLVQEAAWYVDAAGQLDVDRLLGAFQSFFREHSEHWVGRFDYREAGPQLLLQAFLQRIVNGGGYVEREYGLGRGRVDLLIVWPHGERRRKFVVECKVAHKGRERTIREGVAQTLRYLERSGAESGHLVVFDRGTGSWDEKIFRREQQAGGRRIVVWGM